MLTYIYYMHIYTQRQLHTYIDDDVFKLVKEGGKGFDCQYLPLYLKFRF